MTYDLYEGEMAKIFDIMYQQFINYDEEFAFYNKILQNKSCHKILEIGSGTGNLASRFHSNSSFEYQGLDYSHDMIKIATKKNKNIKFNHGDMRCFKLNTSFDVIIMTGRTSSYIISNKDFYDTLDSVLENLTFQGYFIFDFIDGTRYIPYILTNKNIEHTANFKETEFSRIANWTPLEHDNFLLKWEADYY